MQLDVRPFGRDALFEALQSPEHASSAEVAAHPQAEYLLKYLDDIGAKCILVEEDYTDGDYLDDFATYYVKSFHKYERLCRRLHFFSTAWDQAALSALLREPTAPRALQDAYLGFIVRRPLPDAIIGRTVLRTYDRDKGARGIRLYPTIRPYVAHLFGTELKVKSLAFQEQDRVLAACATVSLWSAFHKTKELFGTAAPSPAEITRSATSGVIDSRPFPSKGLIVPQIAHAIRSVDLEPELFECNDELPLLSLLVAYVSLGIPPILGLTIGSGIGLHAVAVAGYSLRDAPVHALEDWTTAPPQRIGLRVDELYVHDDGRGPFARIRAHVGKKQKKGHSAITFTGEWSDPKTGKPASLTPLFVMVPVYHKIRLSFLDVQKWITQFQWIVDKVFENAPVTEWDVTLATTNDVKHAVKESTLEDTAIDLVLTQPQPRFLWRALMRVAGHPVLEVQFDATDMVRSQMAFALLFHVPEFASHVARVLQLPD